MPYENIQYCFDEFDPALERSFPAFTVLRRYVRPFGFYLYYLESILCEQLRDGFRAKKMNMVESRYILPFLPA
jgi:hypothetical protein